MIRFALSLVLMLAVMSSAATGHLWPNPPAQEPKLPPMPALDVLQRFRCDLAITDIAGTNSEWQSYKWAGWGDEKRDAFIARTKARDLTHVVLNFSIRYQDAEFDFRQDPATFTERLKELRRANLIPILNAFGPETYGANAEPAVVLADLERFIPVWRDYLGGAFFGFEMGDRGDGRADTIVAATKKLRELLGPNKVVGIAFATPADQHPVIHDRRLAPEARTYFTQVMGRGVVDTLLVEIGRDRFDTRDRRKFFDDLAGLNPRVSSVPNPLWSSWPWGHALTSDERALYHPNWSGPDYGLGMRLVYFEGPAFSRWASAEKDTWGTWAMTIPGVAGYCDGGRLAA